MPGKKSFSVLQEVSKWQKGFHIRGKQEQGFGSFATQFNAMVEQEVKIERRMKLIKKKLGTSLVVQWLRLHVPNAEGPGSIPGQGTRSHMHAATKTRRSQINK